jgi:hypothetical protein
MKFQGRHEGREGSMRHCEIDDGIARQNGAKQPLIPVTARNVKAEGNEG